MKGLNEVGVVRLIRFERYRNNGMEQIMRGRAGLPVSIKGEQAGRGVTDGAAPSLVTKRIAG